MPCEGVDPATMKPNGNWHFCCVTTSKMNRPLIYPIGYCRKNKCVHKTAQEANDCYRTYELEHEVKIFTGEDIALASGEVLKGRNEYAQCRHCGLPTKQYCHVGVMETEYYMCADHMQKKYLEKLHPRYEVNFIKQK